MCVMHIMQISRHLQFTMARARGYTLAPEGGHDEQQMYQSIGYLEDIGYYEIPAGVPTHRLDNEDELEEEAVRWQHHLLGREELENELRVVKELLVSVMREHAETKRQLALQQELWVAHQHWLQTLCGSVWDQQEWMRQNRIWSSTGQAPPPLVVPQPAQPPPAPLVAAKAPPAGVPQQEPPPPPLVPKQKASPPPPPVVPAKAPPDPWLTSTATSSSTAEEKPPPPPYPPWERYSEAALGKSYTGGYVPPK
jgi:hypothetical protein